jgi:hypothetical protein
MRIIQHMCGTASGVRNRALLIAATLAISTPLAAHAPATKALARQLALYGVLRQAADSTPLAGALVVAVERATNTPRHSAVSNAAGRFALALGDTSGLDLRILRLGHRPHEIGAINRLLPGPATLYVPTSVLSLATLKVGSRSNCATAAEEGAMLASVLSEIDKALALSTMRATDTRYRATIRRTVDETRSLAGGSVRVADQLTDGEMSRPFASVPIDQLMEEGYVIKDGQEMEYRAPDAQVLLSHEFRLAHCFHVVHGKGQDSLRIGVEFSPVKSRGRHVDVAGTMWVDRATSLLQRVEFTYDGVPASHRSRGVGGYFELGYLPDGLVFVRDWAIRMPLLEEVRSSDPATRMRDLSYARRVAGLRTQRGVVMVLRSANQTLFEATDELATSKVKSSRSSVCLGASEPIPNDTLAVVRGRLLNMPASGDAPYMVTASWRERFLVAGRGSWSWKDQTRSVSVREPAFSLCGIPSNHQVTLRVTQSGRVLGEATIRVPARVQSLNADIHGRGS